MLESRQVKRNKQRKLKKTLSKVKKFDEDRLLSYLHDIMNEGKAEGFNLAIRILEETLLETKGIGPKLKDKIILNFNKKISLQDNNSDV